MARILVIDDSPTVIEFVRGALGADEHEVTSLGSFVHLPAIVRDHPPDLVLLDLNMPALSGIAMGQMVRKYERKATKIVIYSSRPRHEMTDAARALDAITVLRKSADIGELRTVVNGALTNVARA